MLFGYVKVVFLAGYLELAQNIHAAFFDEQLQLWCGLKEELLAAYEHQRQRFGAEKPLQLGKQ